ncbi:MAG: LPS assembly lipoprotein LptE [Phycisphaerales bacterium JB064]
MRLACIALGLMITLAGCASDPRQGYSFESSYDQRVETISVNVFENETYHPGIEADLTAALIKRVQRDTPWKVVNPASAQTTLTGTIKDVQIRRLTQDSAGGITQQAAVRVLADFEWRSTITGRVLARQINVAVTESFTPAAGEPIEVGLSAATDELAGAILEAMRSVW